MNKYLSDPVLNLTAGALRFLYWAALAIVALTTLITLLFLFAMGVTNGEVAGGLGKNRDSMMIFMMIFMPTAAVLFFLTARFLKMLRDLVLSVTQGQPLTAINAGRLRSMGWLSLAIQGVLLITTVALAIFGKGKLFDVDMVYDLITGMLTAAVLFILARVFDYGADMREELEGTI
jgi:hypothetical protein